MADRLASKISEWLHAYVSNMSYFNILSNLQTQVGSKAKGKIREILVI